MSGPSSIEWTDATWNPIRGCTRITTGCGGSNHEGGCYAEKIAARFSGPGQPFHGFAERAPHGGRWTGKLALIDSALTVPFHWKKPRRIFVNSMSDLFHENLPDEAIDKVFAVMALAPQHTFQVLTKRPERMRKYLAWDGVCSINDSYVPRICGAIDELVPMRTDASREARGKIASGHPLPNVWLGVSTERQQEADERIPHLLQTPAAVRFISAEPLLGPIDLTEIEAPDKVEGERWTFDALTTGDYYTQHGDEGCPTSCGDGPYREHKLAWIIVGGESGPNARPMQLEWAMAIVDQCAGAEVACFVKQLGSSPISSGYPHPLKSRKGGDPDEWPRVLNVRRMPKVAA